MLDSFDNEWTYRDNGEYVPYVSKLNIAIETDYISNLRYGDSGIPFSDAFPSAQWVEVDGSAPSVSATTVRVEFGEYLQWLLLEGSFLLSALFVLFCIRVYQENLGL